MNNGWTLERRKQQAEMIKQWQPWKQSTGPKTAEGKKCSSRNAFKNARAIHKEILELKRLLRRHEQFITDIKNC